MAFPRSFSTTVASQHNARICLQRRLRQILHGYPVMAHRERFEPEDCLEFDHVLPPGLGAIAVFGPLLYWNLKLRGHQLKQRRRGQFPKTQDDARIPHVAELHGEAEPVGHASSLTNDRQVGVAQGIATNQFILGIGQGQQAFTLGGGKHRTTGHDAPLENAGF
jgi:hypothetical protein